MEFTGKIIRLRNMRIKAGKVLFILMILLLSIGANSTINTHSFNTIDDKILTKKDIIGPVDHDDFSNFTLHENNPNVTSTKSNHIIYYSYNGCSTHYYNHENYILDLGLFGNVSDFSITTRFQFNMSYDIDELSFAMIAGSYYNYDRDIYLGLPYYLSAKSYLAEIGIIDNQPGESARYFTSAYPYGIENQILSPHSSADLTDVLELLMIRNFSGLYAECRVPYTDNILTCNYWATGIDIPVNYILLDFMSGYEDSNVNLTAFDFEGSFYFGDVPVYPDTMPPFVYIHTPANGTNIYDNNTVEVDWDASDVGSGIEYTSISLDYGPWINVTNPIYTSEYTFYDLAEGYHVVWVQAFDYFSNKGEDITVFGVFEDETRTIPPTIALPGFTYIVTILSTGIFALSVIIIKRCKKK